MRDIKLASISLSFYSLLTLVCMWISSGSGCPVCGSYNSGKLSCCAPGGSWFKKCGSPPKLYTWLQGTQTCNSETTYTRIMFSYAIIRPKLLVTRDARGLSQTLVGQFCDIYSAPINSLGHACVISFPQYHATRLCSLCFWLWANPC